MTQEQEPNLISDEMKASIGKEGAPQRLELDKTPEELASKEEVRFKVERH